jgi:hypothetical protein
MNRSLWGLQIVLGVFLILVGIAHFVVPGGLPGPLSWMYELPDALHVISGTADILGGLGLILPGLSRIQPELTVWAAAGLLIVLIPRRVLAPRAGGTGQRPAQSRLGGPAWLPGLRSSAQEPAAGIVWRPCGLRHHNAVDVQPTGHQGTRPGGGPCAGKAGAVQAQVVMAPRPTRHQARAGGHDDRDSPTT